MTIRRDGPINPNFRYKRPSVTTAMRVPTSQDAAYRYHSRVLMGVREPVYEDDPQPGWYLCRKSRGVYLPAVIWIESEVDENGDLADDEQIFAEVGGVPEAPNRIWLNCAKRPISQGAFEAAMLDLDVGSADDVAPAAFNPSIAPVPLPF